MPGAAPSGGAGSPPPPSGAEGIPWESRQILGFFPALLDNLRFCLFDPTAFFTRMPKRDNLGSALGYLVLLGWVGAAGGILWGLALKGPQTALLRSMGITPGSRALSPAVEGILQLGILFLAPVFILIGAFIWSAVLHLVLWILGGAKEGFEATVRVVSYSSGSTYLFELIPICGGFVGFIWSLVLQIIGISRAHGISSGKAAVAVLLPLALCCVIVVALIAAFAGILLAAFRS
jgi:hypothetical protein